MGPSSDNLPIRKTLVVTALTLLFAVLFFLFVQSTFHVLRIRGESMKPGLENGDLLLAVSRSSIQRFDLVVFKDPENPKRHLIKRLVALAGEKLTVQDGRILINDRPLESPQGSSGPALLENFTCQTPGDCCFVLGDNPYSSKDSRHFGPIPVRQIWARVLLKIWPLPWN